MDKEDLVDIHCTMEYYSSKRMKLSFEATWMDLEILTLSDYIRKRKTIMISLICALKK